MNLTTDFFFCQEKNATVAAWSNQGYCIYFNNTLSAGSRQSGAQARKNIRNSLPEQTSEKRQPAGLKIKARKA
jgi:hypothetical protein